MIAVLTLAAEAVSWLSGSGHTRRADGVVTLVLSLAGVTVVLLIGWWPGACLSDQARDVGAAEEFMSNLDAEANR